MKSIYLELSKIKFLFCFLNSRLAAADSHRIQTGALHTGVVHPGFSQREASSLKLTQPWNKEHESSNLKLESELHLCLQWIIFTSGVKVTLHGSSRHTAAAPQEKPHSCKHQAHPGSLHLHLHLHCHLHLLQCAGPRLPSAASFIRPECTHRGLEVWSTVQAVSAVVPSTGRMRRWGGAGGQQEGERGGRNPGSSWHSFLGDQLAALQQAWSSK